MSCLKGVRVPKKNAEKTKRFLLSISALDFGFVPKKSESEIVFALSRELSPSEKELLKKIVPVFSIVSQNFQKSEKQPKNLKEALSEKLSGKELEQLVSGFDIVGSIAEIEIPPSLSQKEKIIANALLSVHRNIKTVVKKSSERKGKFRLRKVKHLAGKKTTRTIHRESGCMFEVDVAKTFFSPRLASERTRIAKQIKEGEIVGAFFAGVGSYPIVFAKHSKMKKAIAIELNKAAVSLMKKNISLNKLEGRIEAVYGDVKKVFMNFPSFFGRIAMPLPKGGEDFLDEAIFCAKNKAIIHFYNFVKKENGFEEAVQKIATACKKNNVSFRVLFQKQVIESSPSKMEVVVDFLLAKKQRAMM